MTDEEAIKLINTMILAMCLSDPNIAIGEVEEVKTALNMAINALKNQTSEDLISRKAVLDLAKDLTFEGGCKHRCVDVIKIIELPSAEPKTAKCHEVYKAHEMIEDRLHCSCGCELVITRQWDLYNYCPNCGAKIVVQRRKIKNK